jgi:hypothetical protein
MTDADALGVTGIFALLVTLVVVLRQWQDALMWAITGKKAHAEKAIHILNSWVGSLKKVTGIDGVLASGLQGFMFVNVAELQRYTDSGWSDEYAKRCGQCLFLGPFKLL